MAFHSVDRWCYDVEIIDRRPEIHCVLLVIDDIYSAFAESSVTFHQYFCMKKDSSSFLISCPGVTVKDSDYHIGNPIGEEQHNHNFYIFVIQIILTKEP